MNARIPTEEVSVQWRRQGAPTEDPNSNALQVRSRGTAAHPRCIARCRLQVCIADRVQFLAIAEDKLTCELKNEAFVRRTAKQIVRAAWRANKELWTAMQRCTTIHMPLPNIEFKALDNQECMLT